MFTSTCHAPGAKVEKNGVNFHDRGLPHALAKCRLTDFLRNGPGHIGYGIAREYRGHGYATAGLKLTLAKARELGIEEAYLSVHKTNPASLAVQQHCGARIDHEDKTEYYTRIATCMESDGLYARGD